MLTTILAFFEYLITLFLLVMLILYLPLTIFRMISGDTEVRRRGAVALGVTLGAGLLLWLIPNGGWHWSLQFALLAILCFIPLNFHAGLRNLPTCPLPRFDRHLLIATVIVLAVGFMIPDLGIKGAMAIMSNAALAS